MTDTTTEHPRATAARAIQGRLTYPDTLPITERRDEILAAIREHQVVIVAGETGSGKSTQLPKFCLEAGRGVDGMIGHTQPRRVAARTIAERRRRGGRVEARRRRRIHRPLHRPGRRGHARQGDDRRHPARRDPARPDAAPLRHADHRRGARAQSQHRLHPRLPQAAPAAAPGPEGHRHQRHDRHRAIRRALRHRRCAGTGDRGDGTDLSGRAPVPTTGRRRVGSAGSRSGAGDSRRGRGALARGARRCARVPVGRA